MPIHQTAAPPRPKFMGVALAPPPEPKTYTIPQTDSTAFSPPANGRPFELPRNAGGPPPIMPPGNTGIVPPHMQNAGNIPAGGSPGQRNGGAVTGIPRMPASAPGTRMPMRNAQPQRYNGVPAKPAQPTGRPTGSRMGQMIGMMMRGRR